uniref:Ovo n=1 Tax=Culex tarsalis TaxID=7177 RepID=A0A1Q3EWF2_CULTA
MRAEDIEPIFIHPGDKTLANKIFACTGVEIDENVTVGPTNICMACKSTIYKSYQFLELCQRNNKIIQNLLASHEKPAEPNGTTGNGLRMVIRTSTLTKKSPSKRRRLNSRRKSIRSNRESSTSASDVSWSDCDDERDDPNEDVDEVMPFRQVAYDTDTQDDSFKQKQRAETSTEARVPLLVIPRNRINSASREERTGRTSASSTVDPAGADDQFQCEFCYVSFPYRLQIRQHIDLHHADRKHELSCKSCSKTFFTTTTLRKHTEEKHAAGPIRCDLCQRTYTTQQGLQQHFRSVMHRAALGEAVFPRRRRSSCASNPSGRRNSVSAGYESDTSHRGRSSFDDDYNPYESVCYDELVTYQCDYCDVRFDDRQSLAKHTDVRPCRVELEPLNLDLLLETMDLDELLQPLNNVPDVTIIEPPIEIVDLT